MKVLEDLMPPKPPLLGLLMANVTSSVCVRTSLVSHPLRIRTADILDQVPCLFDSFNLNFFFQQPFFKYVGTSQSLWKLNQKISLFWCQKFRIHAYLFFYDILSTGTFWRSLGYLLSRTSITNIQEKQFNPYHNTSPTRGPRKANFKWISSKCKDNVTLWDLHKG